METPPPDAVLPGPGLRATLMTPHTLQPVPVGVQPLGPEHDHVASLPASEQLRLDYASLPAMVWTLSADGTCDYVNARWLEFTGRSLAASSAAGGPTCIHPEDRDGLRWSSSATRWRSGSRSSSNTGCGGNDGQYRWLLDIGRAQLRRRAASSAA